MTMMYFGTRDRMQWVKCPASGMGRGSQRYSSDGVFTNGGGWSTSSLAGHLVYEMNWNFLRQTEKEAIRDYYDGTYGSGLIYFLDPFAMSRNVLPAAWANPALALEGGPPMSPVALYEQQNVTPPASYGRTNLATNPLPASDTGWAISGGETLTFIADDGGQPALEAMDPLGDGGMYTDPTDRTNPEIGQWVAFGVDVKGLDADIAAAMALRVMGYGGTEVDNGAVQSRPVTTTGYTRISVAAQVTARDPAGYLRTLIWPYPSPASPHAFRFRKAVVAVADTETAALSAVEPYFDGNTPDTQDRVHFWEDEINNSISVEMPSFSAIGAPSRGIRYTSDAYTHFKKHWIPVPDGYTLHIGAIHTADSGCGIEVVTETGERAVLPHDTDPYPHLIPATAINNCNGGATVSLFGTGDVVIQGIMAQVLPDGEVPQTDRFISGQGHSGCRFSGDIVDTGYSAPSALDYSALSFTLRETGSWE